jgi:hypothetical protein
MSMTEAMLLMQRMEFTIAVMGALLILLDLTLMRMAVCVDVSAVKETMLNSSVRIKSLTPEIWQVHAMQIPIVRIRVPN